MRELVTARRSRFGDSLIEGVVVRRDEEDWLDGRAKLVAPDFTQAITEHWRHRAIVWNRLAAGKNELIDRILERRQHAPPITEEEFRAAREEGRP